MPKSRTNCKVYQVPSKLVSNHQDLSGPSKSPKGINKETVLRGKKMGSVLKSCEIKLSA